MNQAETLLRRVFRFGEDHFDAMAAGVAGDATAHIHPDACHSLFGPSGNKEMLLGKQAFLDFVQQCAGALAERDDQIISIVGVDEQCAFVRARAYRKSKATGEEIRYEWAMLYRVEDGRITYGADMLDADAQAFWGRVLG